MALNDFKMNLLTNDIAVEGYDFQLVSTDIDGLVQRLKIRLQFFFSEWFLDEGKGIPYFTDIFIHNPDTIHVDNLIKATIVETEGVLEITGYQSSFIRNQRNFYVSFTVRSIYGLTEEITLSLP